EVGTEAEAPRKMVLRRIDHQEQRILAAFLADRVDRLVKIERVRVEERGAERLRVEKALNAGGLLEAAGAQEGPVHRIEREGLVAAVAQLLRQSALDPPRRDARDEVGETPVRAH